MAKATASLKRRKAARKLRRRTIRRRRTQEERREETQSRVLDATVECLARDGYSGASTVRIARKAGVSRGALLHHYSSKAELLASAVRHVFRRRIAEFREAFERVPEDANRANAAIDILWGMFSGPSFDAWLELLVASRSDPELRENIQIVGQQFAAEVEETFHELFPAPRGDNPLAGIAPAFTFAFLQGLSLDRLVAGSDAKLDQLLDAFKTLAAMVMPETEQRDPNGS